MSAQTPYARVWEKALAKHRHVVATDRYAETDRRKIVVCVICGHLTERRGNKPILDDNGVAWCLCPNGCESPADLGVEDATMVPLTGSDETVFDVWVLSPGDFMGPTPEEVASRAAEDSVSDKDTNRGDTVLRLPGERPDVCDRFDQSLGRRWEPTPRVATRPRY